MDTILIKLGGKPGRGLFAITDKSSKDLLDKWDLKSWSLNQKGYPLCNYKCPHLDKRSTIQMHQAVKILNDMMLGNLDGVQCICNREYVKKGLQIDHFDDYKMNNRYSNLQFMIHGDNSRKHAGKTCKSIYAGIDPKSNGRYQANCKHNGRMVPLGTFDTEIEAARARDRYIIQYNLLHGRRLNFPLSDYPSTVKKIKIEIKLKIV